MLYRWSRLITVRICLMALLAIAAAFVASMLDAFIPQAWVERFGEESVTPVLNILASSMLVVVTFSLSVMVSAHRQASSQVTPRSHRLLLEDTTTQTVLATFLGAFIYALIAIILFRANYYTDRASVVVFAVTVVVVVLVVGAILRWIQHLSHLGSMDETLALLERRVCQTMLEHRKAPYLRGQPMDAELPTGLVPVIAARSGYVQFVDMPTLDQCCREKDVTIYLARIPGDWVSEGRAIAHIDRADGDISGIVADAFTMDELRSFDQDARFGLNVMAETASRALSPGINDPGTAIDVIGRIERILLMNAPSDVVADSVEYDRVFVPELPESALIRDAFAMIARDGAAMVEVASRLQMTLRELTRTRDPGLSEPARLMAATALAYSEAAMVLDDDKEILRRIAG